MRHDGWTPIRQARFIGHLAETRSVAEAARRVGMAREGAYRLRRGKWSAGFNAAWDAALGLGGDEQRMRDKRAEMAAIDGLSEPVGLESYESHGLEGAKVTVEELRWRVEVGTYRPFIEEGRYAGYRHREDNDALMQLIARTGVLRCPPAHAEMGEPSHREKPVNVSTSPVRVLGANRIAARP